MSLSIFKNLPDADTLTNLDARVLAGYLLEHLHSQGGNSLSQGNSLPHNLANSISSHYRPKHEEVYKAIMAACQWLLNRDLLAPTNAQGFFEISKEGNKIKTANDLHKFFDNRSDVTPLRENTIPAPEVAPAVTHQVAKSSQEQLMGEDEARLSITTHELIAPDKVTFSWLYHHVPVRLAGVFASIVIASFFGGVSLGQTTFVRELLGKEQRSFQPSISSADLGNRVDQLIQGHNESIKNLYSAIANEEREAGRQYFSSEQQPHIEAGDRLKATLKKENETFEQQLKALRELQR